MINSNLGLISRTDTAIYSLKLSVENCGQTAADGDVVTIDRRQKVASALNDGTIADLVRLIVWPQYIRYRLRRRTDRQTDENRTISWTLT